MQLQHPNPRGLQMTAAGIEASQFSLFRSLMFDPDMRGRILSEEGKFEVKHGQP